MFFEYLGLLAFDVSLKVFLLNLLDDVFDRLLLGVRWEALDFCVSCLQNLAWVLVDAEHLFVVKQHLLR